MPCCSWSGWWPPDAHRATALPPLPDYVLLPAAEFQDLAELWSLRRLDEVVIRDTVYVLAKRHDR